MNETELVNFRQAHVGFVFQFFNLVENLTVQANVELPARLSANGRQDRPLPPGIAAHADKCPWEVSGGQQRRVVIAWVLINEPTLLLVDELTGNLDSANAQAVLGILGGCNGADQTILMVTHDARAAAEARQVLFIHDVLFSAVGIWDPERRRWRRGHKFMPRAGLRWLDSSAGVTTPTPSPTSSTWWRI